MKKRILFLFVALATSLSVRCAQEWLAIDGINYILTFETHTAQVYWHQYAEYEGDVVIPPVVRHLMNFFDSDTMDYKVTSIRWNAFKDEGDVTSITLPETIDSIGNSAFAYSGITSITLPKSVKKIGTSLFEGCGSLQSAIFLMDSLPDLPYHTFCSCTSLDSLQLPKFYPGIGAQAFYQCPLTAIDLPEGLLCILDEAFEGSKLTSIKLPNSLQTIGKRAFYQAPLRSIEWPDSLETVGDAAFAMCKLEGEIILPTSVKNWGKNVFYANSNIENVVIPDGVITIGEGAFTSCNGIRYIHFGNTLTDIAPLAFEGLVREGKLVESISIPHNVKTIGERAFRWAKTKAIYIGSGVDSIGAMAFDGSDPAVIFNYATTPQKIDSSVFYFGKENCVLSVPVGCKAAYEAAEGWKDFTIVDTITSMDIPQDYGYYHVLLDSLYYNLDAVHHTAEVTWKSQGDRVTYTNFNTDWDIATANIPETLTYKGQTYTVTSMSDGAFANCENLRAVSMPATITVIPESAFRQCPLLSSAQLPAALTTIGHYAFCGCPLAEINLPSTLTFIGEMAFQGATAKRVDIPNNVTFIGGALFYHCKQLERVTLPEGMTSIPGSMFNDCAKLDSLIIPSTVTAIGPYAFAWAPSLSEITLPEGVDSIGEYAFYCCSGLRKINFPHPLRTIGEKAFTGCNSLSHVEWNMPDFSMFASSLPIGQITHLIVGKDVETIGQTAYDGKTFKDCTKLDSIVWLPTNYPDYEWDILETSVFGAIGAQITSFVFGDDVERIPQALCRGMYKLTSIVIPATVKHIGGFAFDACTGLEQVHISDLAAYCQIELVNAKASPTLKGAKLYVNGEEITDLVVPNDVPFIGPYAFHGAHFASVTLPSSVDSIATEGLKNTFDTLYLPDALQWITMKMTSPLCDNDEGYRVFANGQEVTDIVIPDSITVIGTNMSGSTSLQSLTLHKNVNYIDNLRKCSKLVSFYCYNPVPPQTATDTQPFKDIVSYKCYLHVPKGTKETYTDIWTWHYFYQTIDDDLLNMGPLMEAIAAAKDYYQTIVVSDYDDLKETLGAAINLAQACLDTVTTESAVDTAAQTLNQAVESAQQAIAARLAEFKTTFNEHRDAQADSLEARRQLFYDHMTFYEYESYPIQVRTTPYDSLLIYTANIELIDTMVARMNTTFDHVMDTVKAYFDYTGQREYYANYDCENLRPEYADVPEADSLITAAQQKLLNYEYNDTISLEANFNALQVICKALVAELEAMRAATRFVITFVNWDNSPLLVLDKVREGTVPVYTGDTPERPEDDDFTYTFAGWTPKMVVAVADATYTATYEAIPKAQAIEDLQAEGDRPVKVLHEGQIYILRGEKVYTVTGQEVR